MLLKVAQLLGVSSVQSCGQYFVQARSAWILSVHIYMYIYIYTYDEGFGRSQNTLPRQNPTSMLNMVFTRTAAQVTQVTKGLGCSLGVSSPGVGILSTNPLWDMDYQIGLHRAMPAEPA